MAFSLAHTSMDGLQMTLVRSMIPIWDSGSFSWGKGPLILLRYPSHQCDFL